jgi:hypothetical protein
MYAINQCPKCLDEWAMSIEGGQINASVGDDDSSAELEELEHRKRLMIRCPNCLDALEICEVKIGRRYYTWKQVPSLSSREVVEEYHRTRHVAVVVRG